MKEMKILSLADVINSLSKQRYDLYSLANCNSGCQSVDSP